MDNMPRQEIIAIATSILNNGDIIVKHGTSINNAKNILEKGFDYHRTSFVWQMNKNIEALCNYGWKDNPPNDSANVIIEIPREFIKDLLSIDEEEYQKWIETILNNNNEEAVLNSLTSFEYKPSKKIKLSSGREISSPPSFSAHIPKEFVVGTFIWCNEKTYLRLKDTESALDNLTFIPNNNFYLNLERDSKKNFIEKMRLKLSLEINDRKVK